MSDPILVTSPRCRMPGWPIAPPTPGLPPVGPPPCECDWTQIWSPERLVMTLQHGPNPEQSVEVHQRAFRTTDICERGHAMVLERWAIEVVEYVHRPEPEEERKVSA